MATITSLAQTSSSTTGSTKQWKTQSTVYKFTFDYATAETAKGSALAAADVIECIRVPAGSVVTAAGLYCLVAGAGGSADQTISLGDGGSAARYAATFDADAAVAGTMSAQIPANEPFNYASSDTIDITLTAATTVSTTGKWLVWAEVLDINDAENVGLAQIRS